MGKRYTVTGIELTNSAGNSTIDSTGVVSSVNFTNDTVTNTTEKTITSETIADISGLTLSFSLSRTTKVLFLATISDTLGFPNDLVGELPGPQVFFYLDDVRIGPSMMNIASDSGGSTTPVTDVITISGSCIESVGSGSHVVKLRWKNNDDGGIAYMNYGNNGYSNLSYVILGT